MIKVNKLTENATWKIGAVMSKKPKLFLFNNRRAAPVFKGALT